MDRGVIVEHAVVELKNVIRKYQVGTNEVRAVDGIDLEIYTGEFVLILGPSGSGKTTLLNLMGGIDFPDEGKVIINGVDLTHMSGKELTRYRAKEVGWIFQFFNLIPSLNALENVALALELSGDRDRMEERAAEVLSKLGMGDFLLHFPSQLSGGQQQRVSIARALVKEPEIIIADEPTGNLDHKTGLEVVMLMKSINEELGKTFVVVSHDNSLIDIADRVLHLQDGKIIEEVRRG